ncbi:MAG: hypothetical protein JSW51_01010 [Gemmatimonadota bacterium]|nr:MAG: hypothetical protein JSW51_01010 [Gemmatimonadota bacterium]
MVRQKLRRLWARESAVRRTLLALTLVLVGLPVQTTAQTLTPQDTATVVALVYERVSARWGKSIDIAEPVWIPDSIHHGTVVGEDTWVALEQRVPTIRRAPDVLSVVICPEGQEHRYPSGCPIFGFGRILSFYLKDSEAPDEVTVTVSVGLMAAKDRSYLFGGTCRVRRNEDGEWIVAEILDLRIT